MRYFALIIAVSVSHSIPACPLSDDPTATIVKSPRYELSFLTTPVKVGVGKHFNVEIRVCDENGKPFAGTITPDAKMPMHGHGMNYTPKIESVAAGIFLAEGYLFHMPGKWQLVFDLRSEDGSQRIVSDFNLE